MLGVTTLSPSSALTGMSDEVGGAEAADRERREVAFDRAEDGFGEVDQVHLVDGDDDVPDAQQRGDVGVAAGLRRGRLCAASISMMARSAVEAPVAMLRVYCSWPGVSAMMNLRRAVEK